MPYSNRKAIINIHKLIGTVVAKIWKKKEIKFFLIIIINPSAEPVLSLCSYFLTVAN